MFFNELKLDHQSVNCTGLIMCQPACLHTLCASDVDKCLTLIGQSIVERALRHNTHTNKGHKRELYDIGHLQLLSTPHPRGKTG